MLVLAISTLAPGEGPDTIYSSFVSFIFVAIPGLSLIAGIVNIWHPLAGSIIAVIAAMLLFPSFNGIFYIDIGLNFSLTLSYLFGAMWGLILATKEKSNRPNNWRTVKKGMN
jgi:hypothetical protein